MNLKHITFIVPPKLTTFENSLYIGRSGGPPLNIAFLASVAEKCGVDYDVIDALTDNTSRVFPLYPRYYIQGLSKEEIVGLINEKTEVVGITSMFTSEWLVVREIVDEIKNKFPDLKVILGGEHASADHRQIIKYEKSVDIIFKGESEVS